MTKRSLIFTGATLLVCAAVAQVQRSLVINGRVASTDIRIINGRAYAPIADIAKAMDLTVSVKGNSYELVRAGGTNQVDGLSGKYGDWLFDGGWRFRIDQVMEVQSYTGKYEYYGEQEYVAQDGKALLVVEYSYRNGNRTVQPFGLGPVFLTTPEGGTEKVANNNFNFDGDRWFSKALSPGAEAKGALIFSVDPGFKVKDVLITVGDFTGYDDAVKPKNPTVFRIAPR